MFGSLWDVWLSPQAWLVTLAVLLVAYNYLSKRPWHRLPPGPPVLPLVGSMPFVGLDSDIREPLKKMAAKYGNIFSIFLGSKRVVVLYGYDVLKDALVNKGHIFNGRPDTFTFTSITQGCGIATTQGEVWKEHRRFLLHVLRDLGIGRSILEERIIEEVAVFVKELHKNTNKPYNPLLLIETSVANVMNSVIIGQRREYDDAEFIKYITLSSEIVQKVSHSGVLSVFPWLRFLPGDFFGLKIVEQNVSYLENQYQKFIDEHRKTLDRSKPPSDVIDAYLLRMEEEKSKLDTTFTDKQLMGVIIELFIAGTDTTTTTLRWAIIYMALNPEIQDRLQAEIDSVLDIKDVPTMKHKTRLPLIEACICEIQRLGDVAPFALPHMTTEDVNIGGYFIPKDTMILPVLNSIHMDGKLYPDPDKFNPDRFLDDDKKLVKFDKLSPFSLGKRLCLGEGLARMELFLYFTSMVQHFRFRPSPDHPMPDLGCRIGLARIPHPFHVIIELRKQ